MSDNRISHLAIAFFTAIFLPTLLIFPAHALSMKECSVKYKAAQSAGEATGISWSEFRKAQCSSPAAATDESAASEPADGKKPKAADEKPQKEAKKTESETKAVSGETTFPSSIASKFASEKPSKARMHTCLEQYRVNKAANTLAGMRWIEKGGGYYKLCNGRLKGNG